MNRSITHAGRTLIGAALMLASASIANAQTITFDALPGNNAEAFTGPYSEAGYDVTRTAGAICVGKAYGNAIPSLFGGTICSTTTGATLSIKKSGGGLFRFTGADLSSNDGSTTTYTFAGFVAAASVYSADGLVAATSEFATYGNANAGINVDEVRVTLVQNGNTFSYNIDNLTFAASTVTTVPEPASFALVGAGLAVVAYVRRKRRA